MKKQDEDQRNIAIRQRCLEAQMMREQAYKAKSNVEVDNRYDCTVTCITYSNTVDEVKGTLHELKTKKKAQDQQWMQDQKNLISEVGSINGAVKQRQQQVAEANAREAAKVVLFIPLFFLIFSNKN